MVVLAVAGNVLHPAPAWAQRPQYDLEVKVDPEQRKLSGRAHITLHNDGEAPLGKVLLWRYPHRFATQPAALNDYNWFWLYPYRFDPGTMTLRSARADGREAGLSYLDHPQAGAGTLIQLILPAPIPAGGEVTLDLDYEVRLPLRYGAFGCFRGRCILGGGFYPMVPPQRQGGFDLVGPPARADFSLSVMTPRPADILIHGDLHRGTSARAVVKDARALTLLVGRPAFRTESLDYRGWHVVYYQTSRRPVPTPPEFVVPYWPVDRGGRVLAAARRVIEEIEEEGLPPPPRKEIRLFEGALRTEVAFSLPGAVLVSDRIFDLFPLGSLLQAHEAALRRALFEDYAGRLLAGRERTDDAGWASGVVASYLLEQGESARRKGSVRDDVAKVGFLPEADKILYAPQVPFSTAYFHTREDPDPFRDNLAQFNNQLPRGLALYDKLVDLLGSEAMGRVVRDQLAGRPVREATEAAYGRPLGWFFDQWLGPLPHVDYVMRNIRKSARHVSLVVDKDGDATHRPPPIEPVEVLVRDRRGRSQSQRWDGRGQSHRFDFDLLAPAAVIQLDPRGRLTQHVSDDDPRANSDLRFGELDPAPWKVLLSRSDFALSAAIVDVDLGLSLQRVRDLKNSITIGASHSQLITAGVSALYTRWFGPKVTPAVLAWGISGGLSLARVPALGGAQADNVPGQAITASAILAYDDRLYEWEPVHARTLNVIASYTLTALDSGAVQNRGNVIANWQSILPIRPGHLLSLQVAGGVAFGDIRTAQQLVTAGGPSALRGYSQSDLLGRMDLYGRAEYRHLFTHSLNFNIQSSYYLRGISGSLFVEAALVSACADYHFDRSGEATDVGYTINLVSEWFGLSPTQIGLGVAVPLLHPQRECYGVRTPTPGALPVTVVFTWGQPW